MNLRSRGRKVTALVVVLLLSLAVLGVAYAQWSAMLTINGTVGTGNVSAVFDPPPTSFTNDPPNTDDPGQPEPKDVGVCTIALGATNDIIEITVDNAYPSYECDSTAKFTNNGSVPVKIDAIGCTGDAELTCTPVDGVGDVVNAGSQKSVNVLIHVEDTAAENTTYTCTCTIDLVVWNVP